MTTTQSRRCTAPTTPTGPRRPVAVLVLLGVLGLVIGAGVTLGVAAATDGSPAAADIGFGQDMSVHHEQAVDMATIAGQKASAGVRSLAISIQLSQARESGTMRGWLQLWGAPQLAGGPPMSWMTHGSAGHTAPAMTGMATPMPGMATQQEINRLTATAGPAFDTLFLQLMIRHHQGGVLMARDAAGMLTVPAVRDFALSVIGTQNEEIIAMTTYLLRNGAQPLPPPG